MGPNPPTISPPPTKRRRLSSPRPSAVLPSLPSLPITDLGPSHLRVFSWNVNGIAPFLQPQITNFFSSSQHDGASSPSLLTDSSSLSACLKRWKYPQVVCLQEVKITRRDTKTQHAVSLAVKSTVGTVPGYTAMFGLPRDKYNARGFRGKIYGVCTLIRDDLLCQDTQTVNVSCHIKEAIWDLEGRVLCLELPNQKLVIFNIYAVNGTSNPYHDPQTGAIIGTRHDRKRAFHTDLSTECAHYENTGWTVIIAGDMNIARTPADGYPGRRMDNAHVESRKDFEKKFFSEGLGMVDTFRALWGEEKRKFTYRPRGRERVWGESADRVDLILVSGKVWEGGKVVGGDILDEEGERGPSDHCPLYVTLELEDG